MNLAIIGTGRIVHEALYALTAVDSIRVRAIWARPHSVHVGEELAQQYGIDQVYTDYDLLLKHGNIAGIILYLIFDIGKIGREHRIFR